MANGIAQRRKALCVAFGCLLALGIFLRIPPHEFTAGHPLQSIAALHPQPAFTQIGFDEGLYREYVNALIKGGITSYPDIVDCYIDAQKRLTGSVLPPVRFLFIFAGYIWHELFGCEALDALHHVAAFFSVLTLFLSILLAWRLTENIAATLGIGAFMAFAPTQIHMSQHALVDGFFTFWALLCLWALWENLRAPRHRLWLAAYTVALCCLVLTKENALFVFIALTTLIALNRWLQFGTVTRELLLCTVLGPLLGFVVLVFLAGGLETLRTTYQLSVSKNYQLQYAILTGDGPWHRYLVDLLLVSPVIAILALGSIFRLDQTKKPELFMSIFIGATYVVMCNIKYGMNLRYANMWDMPLRLLAFGQLAALVDLAKKYRGLLLGAAVAAVCVIELRQYIVLFVNYPLYELVSEGLLRALKILKSR